NEAGNKILHDFKGTESQDSVETSQESEKNGPLQVEVMSTDSVSSTDSGASNDITGIFTKMVTGTESSHMEESLVNQSLRGTSTETKTATFTDQGGGNSVKQTSSDQETWDSTDFLVEDEQNRTEVTHTETDATEHTSEQAASNKITGDYVVHTTADAT